MSDPSSERLVVALNRTEWLNLCARGSIRLLENRPTRISDSEASLARTFAAAPVTKLDSSVDLLIVEIRPDWPKNARRHGAHPDVAVLALSDVRSHHIVAAEQAEYFQGLAEKERLNISAATFEDAWREWVAQETVAVAIDMGDALRNALELPPLVDGARPFGCDWLDVAGFASHSRRAIFNRACPVEALLSAALEIDDIVAALRGTEAYQIAAAIEWIDLFTGEDPMGSPARALMLNKWIAAAKQVAWDHPHRQTSSTRVALAHLARAHASAFEEHLPAMGIGLVTRLVRASRTAWSMSDPQTTWNVLLALRGASEAAGQLGCVLVAATIGPERVRQLIGLQLASG